MQSRLFHIEHFGIMRDIVQLVLGGLDEITLAAQAADSSNLDMILTWEEIDMLLLGMNEENTPDYEPLNVPVIGRYIRRHFPSVKIILHSPSIDSYAIADMVNEGADAFVSKHAGQEDLLRAIREVKAGGRYISGQLWPRFKNTPQFLAGSTNTLTGKSDFTNRELEVLRMISNGLTTKEISEILHISFKTIETHRKNLRVKSQAKNTAGLIAFAYAHGLLSDSVAHGMSYK